MHHIYTTPAFVVHSSPHGEAGKFLLLFTKDFGMIGAVAQGIRLASSKLRYHVQDASLAQISVVRGKEVWRLTGAHEAQHERITPVHMRVLKLLKRLLHGEEKNDKLFEIIEELYRVDIEEENFEVVECLIVLRTLNALGYIRNTDKLKSLLENNSIEQGFLDIIKKEKSSIVKTINSPLSESHL